MNDWILFALIWAGTVAFFGRALRRAEGRARYWADMQGRTMASLVRARWMLKNIHKLN